MQKQSMWSRWNSWNHQQASIWSLILLSMVSLSFFLSDWLISIVTFADITLGFVLATLIVIGAFKVKTTQVKWIGLPLAIILINNGYQFFTNYSFNIRLGIASFIKIAFYLVVITSLFNYIKERSFEKKFLLILNWAALILGVIGIYITIALYSDGQLPYRFFWEFTRYDIYSYFFESNPAIIRTRSLFSEPAHFGYFLNLVLAFNLFSRIKFEKQWLFNFLLTLIIFSTFSYSMIGIMGLYFGMKITKKIIDKEMKWHSSYWVLIIGLVVLTVVFWEFIEVTLVQRTLALFSGEDTSAQMRLIESWHYIQRNTILFGNGIGHTPVITNTFAYFQSDLGILGTVAALALTISIMKHNFALGVLFVLLNVSKGGYLGPAYWLMVLCVLVFMNHTGSEYSKHQFKIYNSSNYKVGG
ncbi:hypothetical protein [Marinilactibacillus sp. Marseille-P9653]|uniref:hypothetical protein n=1 Tax=Marinilactibacillus sp. Marseille-P9653 TaxID=2866583 RepID=UPI001CE4AD5E|nr:hypothetical protein [Marinilactibacillus sp. Marseille-P9653]